MYVPESVHTGTDRSGQTGDPGRGLSSALDSVKSLVSIVMGLALTHTIITVVCSSP